MKKMLALFLLFFALYSCDHDSDSPVNPVDQLPPATQIGANTFGCLLDGEVFKPGNGANTLSCHYQFVDGGYYFFVGGQKYDNLNNLISIDLATKNKQIFQNQIFPLFEYIDGNASGGYLFNLESYSTTHLQSGELSITKLDLDQDIVSGTFYFDVLDSSGVVHEIRNGRFDMHFTQ